MRGREGQSIPELFVFPDDLNSGSTRQLMMDSQTDLLDRQLEQACKQEVRQANRKLGSQTGS